MRAEAKGPFLSAGRGVQLSPLSRLRVWLRQWRRKRAFKRQKGDLREFVYLDEVSVYSLIASRLGPIASEFTETQTVSLQSDAGSSLQANLGVAKGEVSARTGTSQTRGSQVLRRSIVQTQFKELYDYEKTSLVMCPVAGESGPPRVRTLKELANLTKAPVHDGWLVDPEKLTRGQLFETEVHLEAEPIFHVTTVVSTFLEMFEENPQLFEVDSLGGMEQIRAVDRVLAKLLVGLVPVRGQAVDYEIVGLDGKEWIVHRKLLSQLSPTELPSTQSLVVVGVAEQSLFWKDIRRILFSNVRFRVLGRMAQDGLQDSWTPVKLVHVLESVSPDVAQQIDTVGSMAFAAMSRTGTQGTREDRKRSLWSSALVRYAALLAEHYGHTCTEAELSEVGLPAKEHLSSLDTQAGRRDAFESIASFLLERFGIEREPLVVAQYRAAALVDAGLDLMGQPLSLATPVSSDLTTPSRERFLDTEFVAIYW